MELKAEQLKPMPVAASKLEEVKPIPVPAAKTEEVKLTPAPAPKLNEVKATAIVAPKPVEVKKVEETKGVPAPAVQPAGIARVFSAPVPEPVVMVRPTPASDALVPAFTPPAPIPTAGFMAEPVSLRPAIPARR